MSVPQPLLNLLSNDTSLIALCIFVATLMSLLAWHLHRRPERPNRSKVLYEPTPVPWARHVRANSHAHPVDPGGPSEGANP